LSFEQMLGQASEGMQALMKALVLPPGRPTREAFEVVPAQREQLKMGIRRYFEEHGLEALAFPPTLTPAPKIGEDIEVDIGGRTPATA
jgi:indoleacetamide hydrolase